MIDDPVILTAIAVLLLLAIVVVAVMLSRRRRNRLARDFGPEYDRAVATYGRRRAGHELEERRERVGQMSLRDLDAGERAELAHRWQAVQTRFVDQPAAAVADADALIGETMRRRGYPLEDVADDERREADLSVAHPSEVALYREASGIAHRSRENRATTEELRQAMVHFRSLFERLVGAGVPAAEAELREPVHRGVDAEPAPERPVEPVLSHRER